MNRKKTVFGMLIIVNILILIILVLLNKTVIRNLKNTKYGQIKYETKERTVEEDMKIYPQGSFKVAYLYKGEVSLDMFYTKLYSLVKYLPNLYSQIIDLDNESLQMFFENNKNNIKTKIEISDFNEFEKLIKILSIYKDNIQYEDIIIDENSYKENEKNVEFNIKINFSENRIIQFKTYIDKEYGEKHVVRFVPIEN